MSMSPPSSPGAGPSSSPRLGAPDMLRHISTSSTRSRLSWQQQLAKNNNNNNSGPLNGSNGTTREERRASVRSTGHGHGHGNGHGFSSPISPKDPLFRHNSNATSSISSGDAVLGGGNGNGGNGGHERRRSIQVPHPHVPQLPTVGLLGSLAGAAHLNPGGHVGSPSPHRETFRPTFAAGEDRTKLDDIRQSILDDTLALFSGKASLEIFQRHWRQDATFEDPLTQCRGYKEYTAYWFALPKLVSKSTTLSHRVLASTRSPSRIVFSQKQEYILKVTKKKKVIESMVVIHLDSRNRISKLEDKWRGAEQSDAWASRMFRRLNAKTLPLFIRTPHPALSSARPSLDIASQLTSTASGSDGTTSYPPRPLDSAPSPLSV